MDDAKRIDSFCFVSLRKVTAMRGATGNQSGFQSKNFCSQTTVYLTLYSLKSKSITNFMWPEAEL